MQTSVRWIAIVFLWVGCDTAWGEQPPGQEAPTLSETVEEAVHWLVENQKDTGAWGSHHSPRPIEVLCDVPGSHDSFRVATTALCVMALSDSPYKTPESRRAADRGLEYVLRSYNVKRPSGFEHYSVWAFGYSLQCLGEWLLAHPNDPRKDRIVEVCQELLEKLKKYQCLDGGWGYLSLGGIETYQPSWTSMSFTTATLLVGVSRVKEAGIDVNPKLVERAVRSVERSRTPVGSYTYGELWRGAPAAGINGAKGAACRASACQYSIELFGREVPMKEKLEALENLLIRHLRFQKIGVRRPIPHEAWYSISGYFYLYGMAYTSYVLEGMSVADQVRFARPLFEAILYCRQPDGSFWDYPLYSYHKPYGTAYALIALARLSRNGMMK